MELKACSHRASEYAEKVVKPYYPNGISPAIKDLMRKAFQEQKQKERKE